MKSDSLKYVFRATHDLKQEESDASEGETDEGDYTVYECPGLGKLKADRIKFLPYFLSRFSRF